MAGFLQRLTDYLRGDPLHDNDIHNPGRRNFLKQTSIGAGSGLFLQAMGPLAPALENFSELMDTPADSSADPQLTAIDPYYQAIIQEYNPRAYARAQFQSLQGGQFSRVFSYVIEGGEESEHAQKVYKIMQRSMPSSTAYTMPGIQQIRHAEGYYTSDMPTALSNGVITGRWSMAGFNASMYAQNGISGSFSGSLEETTQWLSETNALAAGAAGNLSQVDARAMPNAGAPGYFGMIIGGSAFAEHAGAPEIWQGSAGQLPDGYVDIIACGIGVPLDGELIAGTSFSSPQVTGVLMEIVGRYAREIANVPSLAVLYGIDYDDIHNPYYEPLLDSMGVDRNRVGWEIELKNWRTEVTGRINQIITEALLISADPVPPHDASLLIPKENAPAYDPQGTGYGRLNISRFEHVLQDTMRLYRIRERETGLFMPTITSEAIEPQDTGHIQGFAISETTFTLPNGTERNAASYTFTPLSDAINPHDIFGYFELQRLPDTELTFYIRSPQGTVCPVGTLARHIGRESANSSSHYIYEHVFDTSGFLRESSAGTWELFIVPNDPNVDLSGIQVNDIHFGARGTAYEQTIFVDPKVALANETLSHDIINLERAVEATPLSLDREEHLRLYSQLETARALHNTYMQSDIPIYDYSSSPPTSHKTFQSILEHVVEQLEVLAEYKRMTDAPGADALLAMADKLFAATHHSYAYILDDGTDPERTQSLKNTRTAAIAGLRSIEPDVLQDAIREYCGRLDTFYPNGVPGHPDFKERERDRIERRILPELETALNTMLDIIEPPLHFHQNQPQQHAGQRIA